MTALHSLPFFFEKLFSPYNGEGLIELSSYDSSRHRLVSYVRTVEEALESVKVTQSQQVDVYFGVLPRFAHSSSKSSIKQGAALYVDIDAKDMKGGKDEALEGLSFACTGLLGPTFIVDSGNGYHAYWLLDKPTSDIGRLEKVNKGLARVTRGDDCFNANRILRVPGTKNWKDRTTPKPVEIIRYTGHTFDLQYFDELIEEEAERITADVDPSSVNVADVQNALCFIPADDYSDWICIGMALKNTFGEEGFHLWDEWSQKSPKYRASEMRRRWRSFQGEGLTVASVFYFAVQNGYRGRSTACC